MSTTSADVPAVVPGQKVDFNEISAEKSVANCADKAANFLLYTEGYEPLSAKEEKKLKRRIDWIMIPMLFLIATLGAVDKVSLSTAALYSLREDNNLVGQQYSWLGSILSLGVSQIQLSIYSCRH